VGLEPSCVSVFRDELPNLFAKDQDAKRMAGQTFTLDEFLEREVPDFRPPKMDPATPLVVHGHCHHRSVLKFDCEQSLLEKMGLNPQFPDPGCCGMAGAFGFERRHYPVSMAVAERKLLPALRKAPEDSLVLADGFSCRTQIEQSAGRAPMHLAELLRLAIRQAQ
jgi:Fe-S oxidoreductase